ncbi:16115_t:CDS:2 [Funneliformis mosseae]|uniref:16115_t:CDS:1 n=1 Tax=Funneliformis mosseae TaxID=27381 RepID=A0A9N9HIK4_FUNMO|nr:16115_t:CDS:2 [Funneliformis mosseae]
MADPTNLEFFIGFVVSILASIMYAAGLNLLKADHVKNSALPKEKQRVDCSRPLWHLGLYLYIVSQAVGSTIALNYLKTQWVAPLGSVSLIFNFIFAKMLVGTQITQRDILGTIIVLISVCWVVFFGGLNNSHIGLYFDGVLLNEKRKERKGFFKNVEMARLKIYCGMIMATVAGLYASQTLLLAKSGVKLFFVSISTRVNQFTDLTGWFVLLFLIITAFTQEVPSSETEDENSIHGDDDDKSFSGFSSWSGDSFFNKKSNPTGVGRKKWTGGGIRGLFKKNGDSNIQGEKGGVKREFKKFGLKEEKIKSMFLFIGFKTFYYNNSVNSDGIGIGKKEWSGDLGSIINLDKLVTENLNEKKTFAENVEKGGFAV